MSTYPPNPAAQPSEPHRHRSEGPSTGREASNRDPESAPLPTPCEGDYEQPADDYPEEMGLGAELPEEAPPRERPRLRQPARGRRLAAKTDPPAPPLTADQRLLLLDVWRRSGLPAGDFAALVGLSKHSLYDWKHKFETEGPAGLQDKPRGGPKGSRLPEITRRAILMLKQDNPDWGCEKISAMLLRGPALPASPQAVARILHEAGYETQEAPTRPHPDKVRHFERARPNQLWQTDLFTFVSETTN